MSLQTFKCKIVNSTYHTSKGQTIQFGPTERNPNVGYYVTADVDEIAELSALIKSFGRSGGHIYQDNEPVDLPKMVEAVEVDKEKQEAAVQARMAEIDQGKLEALKILNLQREQSTGSSKVETSQKEEKPQEPSQTSLM